MSNKFLFLFFIILFSSSKCGDKDLLDYLKSFIQKNVPNGLLVRIVEILRQRDHQFPDNYEKNKLAFENHKPMIKLNKGYIEDQKNYHDMQYGQIPLSQNGCGVISTYNVLFHLTNNDNIDFPGIIRDLENDGIILNGAFGTSMVAIRDYFLKNGFKAPGSCKVEEFNKIGEEHDATILTIYNNADDITAAMHFIAITKKDGIYKVHNNGARDGAINYTSLDDVLKRINNGKAKGVYLTGVSKN